MATGLLYQTIPMNKIQVFSHAILLLWAAAFTGQVHAAPGHKCGLHSCHHPTCPTSTQAPSTVPTQAPTALPTEGPQCNVQVGEALDYTGYSVFWSDEFDETFLNEENWDILVEGENSNGELQFYTNREANVRLADGNLVIEARKEQFSDERVMREYTSARLISRGEWQYGIMEARVKVPVGQGMWPAFWLLHTPPINWPNQGEIDVMEFRGNVKDKVSGVIHCDGGDPEEDLYCGSYARTFGDLDYTLPQGESFGDCYHTFAVKWFPQKFEWYVDGNLFQTQVTTDDDLFPFDKPFNIILNLAVGGNFFQDPSSVTADLPKQMLVDWVRVHQKPLANLTIDTRCHNMQFEQVGIVGPLAVALARDATAGDIATSSPFSPDSFLAAKLAGNGFYFIEIPVPCCGVGDLEYIWTTKLNGEEYIREDLPVVVKDQEEAEACGAAFFQAPPPGPFVNRLFGENFPNGKQDVLNSCEICEPGR